MRVLIALKSLKIQGGAQVWTRDLALGLRKRGHEPIVFCTEPGEAAAELRLLTIPLTSDLASIGATPSVVHGNSSLETLAALQQFPTIPGVFVCHGWWSWYAAPPRFPRIRRYVAVDDTCRDRMIFQEGIPEDRVSVVLNAVDLGRFTLRAPLPARPRRALIFSNYANEMTHVAEVREACRIRNMELDVIGWSSGNPIESPETALGQYDLVFAKARSALEALATGSAVVLCDAMGMGPLVTSASVEHLRRLNFGMRALDRSVTVENLLEQIDRYDPADAAKATEVIRGCASSELLVDALVELYAQAIEEQSRSSADPESEALAMSRFLQKLSVDLSRPGDGEKLFPVLGLANRVLRTPVIGPALRWAAKRIAGRGGWGQSRWP